MALLSKRCSAFDAVYTVINFINSYNSSDLPTCKKIFQIFLARLYSRRLPLQFDVRNREQMG